MRQIVYIIIFLLAIGSCGKQEGEGLTTKDPSTNNSVKIEKVTSITSKPGRNRLELSWREPANLGEIKLSKYRVYWNSGKDSLDVPAKGTDESVLVLMEDLEEVAYVFSIYAYDKNGNKSAMASGYGKVYGSQYEKALVNRPVKSAIYDPEKGTVEISWNLATTGATGSEIQYTDNSGVSHILQVSIGDVKTMLNDFKEGTEVSYRTLFLPQSDAIDVFSTEYNLIEVRQQQQNSFMGTDWVLYSPLKKIHLDDDVALQIFNWTTYKSVCSPVMCADYNYDSNTLTETFRILNTNSNRSEIRIHDDYSTGSRQFDGYLKINAPLNDESLMQIFGSTSENATQLMIRGFAENGGTLKISTSFVLATGVYNREVHVNVIHLQEDVGGKIIVYIDGVKKFEKVDNENAVNYMKYGCYGTMKTGTATSQWRDVKFYKNGKAPN